MSVNNELRDALHTFQQEIFNRLSESEKNNTDNYNRFKTYIDDKFLHIDETVEKFTIQINDLTDFKFSYQPKLDKISDLIKFKEITEDKIEDINKGLINVTGDLYSNCARFDKTFQTYLEMPGLIGEGSNCKYLSLRDYLLDNLLEIKNFKSTFEKLSAELKHNKRNIEMTSRTLQETRQNNEKYINEFVINLVDNKEAGVITRINQFEKDISNVRVENGKYHLQAMKNVKELKDELDKFLIVRDEVNEDLKRNKKIFTDGTKVVDNMHSSLTKTEKTHNDINIEINVSKSCLIVNYSNMLGD